MSLTQEDILSHRIIRAAIETHRTLGGPGLLEKVYEEAFVWELTEAGLNVQRQMPVPIIYKTMGMTNVFRLDLLVEEKVIVECKAVLEYNPIFEAQLLTYLRMSQLKLGLVINFGEHLVKDGIHRVVNDL